MTTEHTHGLLNSAPQRGKPGSCYLAQIFDADDKSVATIDATQDETEGTGRARRLVACWNACHDEDITYLEGVISLGTTLRKEMNAALTLKETYQHELCAMERQRDALLTALNRLANAAFARDTTMGDQCSLFAVQAELRDATKIARAAITKAGAAS